MAWHRLVKIHKSVNNFIHYTVESHEHEGLSSTLCREGEWLIIDFQTTMDQAAHYDRVVESIVARYAGDKKQ